jgi:outer membrane protein assembly factor BamB
MGRWAALLLLGWALASGAAAETGEGSSEERAAPAPDRVWSLPLFGQWSVRPYAASRLAEDQGRAYVGTREGRVYAVDADSGGMLWTRDVGARVAAGPVVDDDKGQLYVGTDEGEVLALAADDGSEIWRQEVSSQVIAQPRVAAGMVLLRTADGFLWALRTSDGGKRWSFSVQAPSLVLRGGGQVAFHDGLAIAGFSNGELVAVDVTDGSAKWREKVATPSGRTELERMVDVDAAPQVVDGTVVAAAYHGKVVAMEAGSGRQIWSRSFSVHNDPVVHEGRVYILTEDGHVVALDRSSGGTLWTQKGLAGRGALSDPAWAGGWLVVGDGEGALHWIDPGSGRIAARQAVGLSAVHSTPLALGDGHLLALTSQGTLNRVEVW